MSEKKMVSRNVAIALGIICIILIAVIADFTITSISAQNSYNNLQNQNEQLQNQVNNLTSIVDLSSSTVWVNNETITVIAGGPQTKMTFQANYPGYITISVGQIENGTVTIGNETSLIVTILVEVHSVYNETVGFNQETQISPESIHSFYVLPSSVEIGIYNPIPNQNTANVTLTIRYYY